MFYTVKTIANNSEKESKKPLTMAFFVIKKKIYKKAVDRNKVKRRARKAFLDAFSIVKKDNKEEYIQNFFTTKRILFFLERDMIQGVYSSIVEKMVTDLTQLIQRHKY